MQASPAVQLLGGAYGRRQPPMRKPEDIVCPFCGHRSDPGTPDDIDTRWCKHVVGFTDDGRVMEARVMRPGPLGFPVEYVGGASRIRIRRGDVVVPGVSGTSRVYRRNANAPHNPDGEGIVAEAEDVPLEVPTGDTGALLTLLDEQRQIIRQLGDRIDQLERRRPRPEDDDETP